MPTSPSELFDLATFIRSNFLTEAGRRSAMSRGYYAAMHCAVAVFGKPGERLDGESSHKAVIRTVRDRAKAPGPARTEASIIAQELDRLRRLRNRADYELTGDIEKAACDNCLSRAQKLMEHCASAQGKLDALAERQQNAVQGEPPTPPSGPRPGLKRIK